MDQKIKNRKKERKRKRKRKRKGLSFLEGRVGVLRSVVRVIPEDAQFIDHIIKIHYFN